MEGYHVAQARPGDKVTMNPRNVRTEIKHLLRTDVAFRLGIFFIIFHFTFTVYHGCGNVLLSHK